MPVVLEAPMPGSPLAVTLLLASGLLTTWLRHIPSLDTTRH